MHGAEAVVTKKGDSYVKVRSPKGYRHPDIDEQLRKRRTRAEAKLLLKAKILGIPVPDVEVLDDYTLKLSEIQGKLLKEVLDERPELAEQVGVLTAKLHEADLIHGDLTTSNMILNEETVFLIDFGLGFHSKKIEDKAVDVHLFKQALESKHHSVFKEAYSAFLKGYDNPQVIERLKNVESRGKNK